MEVLELSFESLAQLLGVHALFFEGLLQVLEDRGALELLCVGLHLDSGLLGLLEFFDKVVFQLEYFLPWNRVYFTVLFEDEFDFVYHFLADTVSV